MRESMLFGSEIEAGCLPAALHDCQAFWRAGIWDFQKSSSSEAVGHQPWLSLSGSDQAREGRLVDALAVRGDEGRDTLR